MSVEQRAVDVGYEVQPATPLPVDVVDRVLRVRLDAPKSGNELGTITLRALRAAVDEAAGDTGINAVVLTASGPDFCTGKAVQGAPGSSADVASRRTCLEEVHHLYDAIADCPAIVAAGVQGRARGLGFALAACCDLVIAAGSATFELPQPRNPLPPALGFAALLRGGQSSPLLHHVLIGDVVTAARAAQLGVVTSVAEDELFAAAVDDLESALRQNSRTAMAVLKAQARAAQASSAGAVAERRYAMALIDQVVPSP